MSRRFRFVAALMALVAFSAYFAEGVLAIFCVPDSPHHTEVSMDHAGGEAHAPATHDAPTEESHMPQCPFSMGGGMTCAPVSMPAAAAAIVPRPASSESAFVPAELNIQLLLAHSLYHPPRA